MVRSGDKACGGSQIGRHHGGNLHGGGREVSMAGGGRVWVGIQRLLGKSNLRLTPL